MQNVAAAKDDTKDDDDDDDGNIVSVEDDEYDEIQEILNKNTIKQSKEKYIMRLDGK